MRTTRGRGGRRRALPAALLALACAGGAERAAPVAGAAVLPPPPACLAVAAGAPLQAAVDAAPDGAALCLAPGVHPGPVRIGRGVRVWGPRDAVIRSDGEGTTVRLEDAGAALLGVTVDGSGGRFDLLDAAVHVSGRGARVEGVAVRNAVFGILVERAREVVVHGNEVIGDPAQPFGLRGDPIRLWETYDSAVTDNRVRDGRDVVLWYARRNRVAGNDIRGGRYGAHLMYSHENRIEGNAFVGNVTGLFVMYSRGVVVRDNVFADAGGSAGIGIGLKESGDVLVEHNLFAHNTIGAYIDTSPLWPDDHNRFADNDFRLNEVAVSFLGRADGNTFAGNAFRDGRAPVEVDAHGDARAAHWLGNHFDDYAGYDLDGDGIGDVPYERRSLAAQLVAGAPALAFYRGTPALALVEAIGRIVPVVEARLILVDPAPRLAPPAAVGPREEARRAH